MTNELPERSPVELQADDCGALITISRQWYEEAISALRAQEKEPCEFCGSHDIGDKRLFPKIGYQFYAGYSKQEDVDEFDEEEVEDINFCPMCGRPLKGEGNGTTD